MGNKVKTQFCTECKCIDPNGQGTAAAKCKNEKYKGDGNCDDGNNNEGCDYDGGDCCEKTAKNNKVKTQFCTECKCLDPNGQDTAAPKCKNEKYKGDGNCDDGNNNGGCEFDGGDCCAQSLGGAVNKKYCTVCKCLDPNPKAPAPKCGLPAYKGDGMCDDANNNA